MKKWILFLVVICSLHSFGQKQKIQVLKAEDLINAAMIKGFEIIKKNTDPRNLLYMDSTLSRKIIDAEFNSGFCIKYPDVHGIYIFGKPDCTLDIAKRFNDRYATEKLFAYYCKLPKFIHSDTIYNIYYSSGLEKMISVLKRYPLKGFKERLKRDYFEWQKLALKSPAKVYPDYKNRKNYKLIIDAKFSKSDLYPDCNLIVLILANTLKDLKEPGFNDNLIEKLKKKQTYPYLEVLFNSSFPFQTYKDYLSRVVETRRVPYYNIEQLVKDSKKFEAMMAAISGEMGASIINNILYCNNNKAWVEVSRQRGIDGYVLELKNHQLKIFKIWEIWED